MSAPEPTLVVHPDKERLASAIAARLVTAVVDAQATKQVAEICLTGGSMGGLTVEALLREPAWSAIDPRRVQVWWGDERWLAPGDPDRNDTGADRAGLGELGLDPARVHRVAGPDATSSPEESARLYEREIRAHGTGAFDIVMLGVGPDGHVASLFPGHPAQLTEDAIAVAVRDSPKPPGERVSLTMECLSRSREVWFLVAGADKEQAVRDGLTDAPADRSTAALVTARERTLWLVDEAAAPRW